MSPAQQTSSDQDLVPAVTTRRDVLDSWLRARLKRIGPLQRLADWGRRHSMAHYPFASACCGIEYLAALGPRFDMGRLGADLPRLSPRHADLLLVLGTVNYRLAPLLRRVWEAMAEPRWVISVGACASSGGLYDNYAVVQGIDHIVPVDVYVPGCPPTPEQIIDGLLLLQQRIGRHPDPVPDSVACKEAQWQ